jgi:hypothetical protein
MKITVRKIRGIVLGAGAGGRKSRKIGKGGRKLRKNKSTRRRPKTGAGKLVSLNIGEK